MKRCKIIVLEGLPGIGKTTITKYIAEHYSDVTTVDEIIYEKIFANINLYQHMYFENDDLKINKAVNSYKAIVDRGPISTLSYNFAKGIIDKNFLNQVNMATEWFEKHQGFLKSDDVLVIYLTNNGLRYRISYDNSMDPYGSLDNQVLLENISIYNCKRYCKNLIIKDVHQEKLEAVADEIINKYLCS